MMKGNESKMHLWNIFSFFFSIFILMHQINISQKNIAAYICILKRLWFYLWENMQIQYTRYLISSAKVRISLYLVKIWLKCQIFREINLMNGSTKFFQLRVKQNSRFSHFFTYLVFQESLTFQILDRILNLAVGLGSIFKLFTIVRRFQGLKDKPSENQIGNVEN